MEDYYRKRIGEYEEIYHRQDPERLKEQEDITEYIKRLLGGRVVLEIAAGTGFWTQFLSETAERIVATDYVEETLELAKIKQFRCPVEFRREDAYNLSFKDNTFTGAIANFWFSHVPKHRRKEFLRGIHRVSKNNSVAVFVDNNLIDNLGGELILSEDEIDTYKLRTLKDGTQYKVLKNYFSRQELFDIFSQFSKSFVEENIVYGKNFWLVYYELS